MSDRGMCVSMPKRAQFTKAILKSFQAFAIKIRGLGHG